MSFLLDTDICSAQMKGNARVHGRFIQYGGRLSISTVTLGLGSPDLDLLNASIALVHNLTLVTHNVQDYANIPGLQVVDWLNP